MTNSKTLAPTRSTALLFTVAAVVWLAFDRLTKVYFEGAYALGQTSPADYLLFRFRLVHNTGAAWGMFGDSTFMLGVTSSIVCALIMALYLFYDRIVGHAPTRIEALALALVFSGGLGNAIDRFMQGYVIDFIDFTFMDFPVFNIADIGVTCGFVLLVGGYLLATRGEGAPAVPEQAQAEATMPRDGAESADASVEVAKAAEAGANGSDGADAAYVAPAGAEGQGSARE